MNPAANLINLPPCTAMVAERGANQQPSWCDRLLHKPSTKNKGENIWPY